MTIDRAARWYSRPELNWDQRFRKPLLYPFELRERDTGKSKTGLILQPSVTSSILARRQRGARKCALARACPKPGSAGILAGVNRRKRGRQGCRRSQAFR